MRGIKIIILIAGLWVEGEGRWTTLGPFGVSISTLSYSHSWGRVISPTICAGSDSQGTYFFDFDKKKWVSQNEGLSNLEMISIAPLRTPQTWNVDPHGFWVSVRDNSIFSGCIAGWFPDNDGLTFLKTSLLTSSSSHTHGELPFAAVYVVVDNRLIFIK